MGPPDLRDNWQPMLQQRTLRSITRAVGSLIVRTINLFRKELLENKRYPFVTGPADSGKSSLLRKTLTSLEPHKYCGVLVDISRLRIQDYTQFMGEFLSAIAKEGDFDTREISSDSPEDTFLAWLGTFPQRLIVFMDGVENCGRGYTGEQIFGKFKFLFNVRDENDEFLRLQFVLSSSQPLSKVVSPQLQTPFLGSELPVLPLSPEQVDGLAWQLNTAQVAVDPHIGALVYRHTSGVAVLCQQLLATLCRDVFRAAAGYHPAPAGPCALHRQTRGAQPHRGGPHAQREGEVELCVQRFSAGVGVLEALRDHEVVGEAI